MQELYERYVHCQFTDKCQYAIEQHELRKKHFTPYLPEEIKAKLIVKDNARHDYKTKLCTNFEKNGCCEYDNLCHYSHGKDELKQAKEPSKHPPAVAAALIGGRHYRH